MEELIHILDIFWNGNPDIQVQKGILPLIGVAVSVLGGAIGAAQNVGYTNATDIDSSLGQTVYSFNGSLSNTLNWNTLLYPRQSTFSFEML